MKSLFLVTLFAFISLSSAHADIVLTDSQGIVLTEVSDVYQSHGSCQFYPGVPPFTEDMTLCIYSLSLQPPLNDEIIYASGTSDTSVGGEFSAGVEGYTNVDGVISVANEFYGVDPNPEPVDDPVDDPVDEPVIDPSTFPSVVSGYLPSVKPVASPGISPAAAWSYYQSKGVSSGPIPERNVYIKELAAALNYDPNTIYEHVRNNIEFMPMFGLKRGGVGAILHGTGTAFDQAHLLVELLREAAVVTGNSITAEYKYGIVTLTAEEFGKWFGVFDSLNEAAQTFTVSANAACEVLANGGIPALINGGDNCSNLSGNVSSINMAHVWVSVIIDGQYYGLDPSFKAHRLWRGESSVGTILGFNSSDLMSAGNCTAGVSCTSFSVANLELKLQNNAENLANWLHDNNAAMRLEQLLGGRGAIIADSTLIEDVALHGYVSSAWWAGHIPDVFRSTLRVAFFDVDHTFFADELADQRLWIELETTGIIGFQPLTDGAQYILRTDKEAYASAYVANYQSWPLDWEPYDNPDIESVVTLLEINHPYAAMAGDYADDNISKKIDLWRPAIIVFGLGNTSSSLQEIWSDYAANAPDNFNTAFGGEERYSAHSQAQHIAAGSWLAQATHAAELTGRIAAGSIQQHHNLGFIYQENTQTYFDIGGSKGVRMALHVMMDIDTSMSTSVHDGTNVDRQIMGQSYSAALSAAEAGVLSETHSFATPAATASIFAEAIKSSPYINELNPSNIGPQLSGYTNAQIAAISSYINLGYRVIAPQSGNISGVSNIETVKFTDFDDFVGTAFVAVHPTTGRMAHVILGDGDIVKGGMISEAKTKDIYAINLNYVAARAGISGSSLSVDLIGGSLNFASPPDLTLGTGENGDDLSFQRYYSSSRGNPAMLTSGWTHNYNKTAIIGTNIGIALGQNRAIDATQAIVAAYAAQNIPGNVDIEETLVRLFAHGWWVKEARNNVVTIVDGPTTSQFVRLPDGSFESPFSNSDVLTQTGTPGLHPIATAGVFQEKSNSFDYTPVDFTLRTMAGTVTTFNVHGIRSGGWDDTTSTDILVEDETNATMRFSEQTLASGLKQTATYTIERIKGDPLNPSRYANTQILESVANSYGRKLSFTYDGTRQQTPLIMTVTDNTSEQRSAVFTYGVENTVIVEGEEHTTVTHSDQLLMATNTNDESTMYQNSSVPWIDHYVPDYLGGNQITLYSATGVELVPGDGLVTYYLVNKPKTSFRYQLQKVFAPSVAVDAENVRDYSGQPLLEFGYNSQGNIRTITNALGNVTEYQLAGRGTASVIDPLGAATTIWYDERGNVIQAADPLGRVTSARVDDFNRTTEIELPEGNLFQYEYDDGSTNADDVFHNITKITQSAKPGSTLVNIVTRFEYGNDSWPNRVTKVTDADGNIAQATYNLSNGSMETLAGAVGTSDEVGTQYSYGSLGRLSQKIFDPSGLNEITKLNYYAVSASGSTKHTNGELKETIADYGGENILVSQEYNDQGDIIKVIDPRGNVSTSSFDDMRRVLSSIASLDKQARNIYDLDGMLLSQENWTGSSWQKTAYVYDDVGQQIKVISPSLNEFQKAYDVAGRPVLTTDPEGHKTKTVYDDAGQVIQIIGAFGSTIEQVSQTNEYSANGQRVSVLDANGNRTEFSYDGHNRLLKNIFPDKTAIGQVNEDDFEQFSYDLNGHVTIKRTRAGDEIHSIYDALGRQTVKEPIKFSSGATAPRIAYAYDAAGRETKVCESTSGFVCTGLSLAYFYDGAGRNTSVTREDGRMVSYEYDAAGNRTKLIWPTDVNFSVVYTYDSLNRLDQIKKANGSIIADYAYDTLSRRTSVTYDGATGSAGMAHIDYAYEADNDLSSLKHVLVGSNLDYGFTYTSSSLMASKSISDASMMWMPDMAESKAYTPNGLNQYASVNGVVFSYDDNGNLLDDGVNYYTYDIENRLVASVTDWPQTHIASYSYDPTGPRRSKTVDGNSTEYLSDIAEEIVEYDNGGSPLRLYIHGPGIDSVVAMIDYTGGAAVTKYYHTDRSGSVVLLSGSTGSHIAGDSYHYGPYGEVPLAEFGGNPIRYTGRRLDFETGLYYYRARYYDPRLGRFLQTDPIGYGDGMNVYAYVGNNPLNASDPTGLACDKFGGVEGYIGTSSCSGYLEKKEGSDVPAAKNSAAFRNQPTNVDLVRSGNSDAVTNIADAVEGGTKIGITMLDGVSAGKKIPAIGTAVDALAEGFEAYDDVQNGLNPSTAIIEGTLEFGVKTGAGSAVGATTSWAVATACVMTGGAPCGIGAVVLGLTTGALTGMALDVEIKISPEREKKIGETYNKMYSPNNILPFF